MKNLMSTTSVESHCKTPLIAAWEPYDNSFIKVNRPPCSAILTAQFSCLLYLLPLLVHICCFIGRRRVLELESLFEAPLNQALVMYFDGPNEKYFGYYQDAPGRLSG